MTCEARGATMERLPDVLSQVAKLVSDVPENLKQIRRLIHPLPFGYSCLHVGPNALSVRDVTCARRAVATARSVAWAASMSPASRASMAASIAGSRSGDARPLATLLHALESAAFSDALPLSVESLQAPDSSPESTLPIAPACSDKIAGPPFDS